MDLLVPVALPPVLYFAPVLTFGVRQLAAALAQASLLAVANLRHLPTRSSLQGERVRNYRNLVGVLVYQAGTGSVRVRHSL